MKMILLTKLLVLTLFFGCNAQTFGTLPAQSQTNHPRAYDTRQGFWSEVNFQGRITKDNRWQYQMEIGYRRMSDASNIPGANDKAPFLNPFQQLYYPWIHYWIIPGSIRLSLNPIDYNPTWTAPDEGSVFYNATDHAKVAGVKTFQNDFRMCPQFMSINSKGRFQFSNRIRYEFRWLATRVAAKKNDAADIFDFNKAAWDFNTNTPGGQTYGAAHLGRLRWQVRAQMLLNSKTMEKNTLYIFASNELFIGVGRHVGYNQNLDQNRAIFMLGYNLPTEIPLRIEAGVMWLTEFNGGLVGGSAGKFPVAAPPGQTNTSFNNEQQRTYMLTLIFDEFHTVFKNKKKGEAAKALHQKQKSANLLCESQL